MRMAHSTVRDEDTLSGRRAAVAVLEAHEIVLAEIQARLDFDQYPVCFAWVREPVSGRNAKVFMDDLQAHLANRIQLTLQFRANSQGFTRRCALRQRCKPGLRITSVVWKRLRNELIDLSKLFMIASYVKSRVRH